MDAFLVDDFLVLFLGGIAQKSNTCDGEIRLSGVGCLTHNPWTFKCSQGDIDMDSAQSRMLGKCRMHGCRACGGMGAVPVGAWEGAWVLWLWGPGCCVFGGGGGGANNTQTCTSRARGPLKCGERKQQAEEGPCHLPPKPLKWNSVFCLQFTLLRLAHWLKMMMIPCFGAPLQLTVLICPPSMIAHQLTLFLAYQLKRACVTQIQNLVHKFV